MTSTPTEEISNQDVTCGIFTSTYPSTASSVKNTKQTQNTPQLLCYVVRERLAAVTTITHSSLTKNKDKNVLLFLIKLIYLRVFFLNVWLILIKEAR